MFPPVNNLKTILEGLHWNTIAVSTTTVVVHAPYCQYKIVLHKMLLPLPFRLADGTDYWLEQIEKNVITNKFHICSLLPPSTETTLGNSPFTLHAAEHAFTRPACLEKMGYK